MGSEISPLYDIFGPTPPWQRPPPRPRIVSYDYTAMPGIRTPPGDFLELLGPLQVYVSPITQASSFFFCLLNSDPFIRLYSSDLKDRPF